MDLRAVTRCPAVRGHRLTHTENNAYELNLSSLLERTVVFHPRFTKEKPLDQDSNSLGA